MDKAETSASSITPAEVHQSEVQLHPLSQNINVEAIKVFKKLVQTSIGNKGKLKIIGNTSGGHVTLTSSSTRLLQNISVSNNILRFVVSSTKSHLSSFGDNGLLCAFLISHILETSLNLPYPKTTISALNDYFTHLYLECLTSCSALCVIEVDFSDTSYLLIVVQNILSSKPACALSENQKQYLSVLLLKAFLNSVPDSSAEKLSRVTFSALEGMSVEECSLYSGLLIRCPDMCAASNLNALKFRDTLKVALFTVSLAGDTAFPSHQLEVHNVDVWKAVLDHLQRLAIKLICDEVHIVACQKVVHPVLKKQLEDKGILVVERLGLDITEQLKHVSAAVPISFTSTSCKVTYGFITGFQTTRIGKKDFYLFQNKKRPLQTLLLCSYSEESLNETKVVCKQVLDTLYRLLQNPKVCYGGGCTEIHVASAVEKMVKRDIAAIAEEMDCYPSQVLAVLQNFVSCIIEAAVSFHQGCSLSFATDSVHHHLWKLEDMNFPSSGASCMCGSYRAEDFSSTHWQMVGKASSVFYNENQETSCAHHIAHKPLLLDQLSARVNSFRVAFETASLLMCMNLCILNKN